MGVVLPKIGKLSYSFFPPAFIYNLDEEWNASEIIPLRGKIHTLQNGIDWLVKVVLNDLEACHPTKVPL